MLTYGAGRAMAHDHLTDRADLLGRVSAAYSVTFRITGGVPERLAAEIGTFAQLQPNWDSHGAPSVNERTRARAMKLIQEIYRAAAVFGVKIPDPDAFPSSDGMVGILWRNPETRSSLEVLIGERGLEASASSRGAVVDLAVEPSGALDALALVHKFILAS